jgi:uncharacterized protein
MDIFCIPYRGEYILYFPFHHTVLLGNAALANLIFDAAHGQASALRRLHDALGAKYDDIWVDIPLEHALRSHKQPEPFCPTRVSLFLTEDCTLRCKYCYAYGGRSHRSMPWNIVTGVIDILFNNAIVARQQTVAVNFHGGDVGAVWPLFVQAREYLRKKEGILGIRAVTSVGTNGVLDETQQRWLTENIDSATLSIDGPPVIHDSQRHFPDGSPSSGFVLKTMRHFDRVKFSYGIRSTITADSVSHMAAIAYYLCTNSTAKRVQMEPMFPQGRAASESIKAPRAQEFINNFRKAQKVASAFDKTLAYSGARLDVLTNIFCKACDDSCVVTPSGMITSCYEVASAEDSLAETFFFGRYDPLTRKFVLDEDQRKHLLELSVLHKSQCKDCYCKWHCAGDCPVKGLFAQGMATSAPPDRCLINRELTKDQLVATLKNTTGIGSKALARIPTGQAI